MAAELIVIGPTTGAAYSYARKRFGDEAPEKCFVPVAPFALMQFSYGHRKDRVPPMVALPGTTGRADWAEWESAIRAAGVQTVEFVK
jgi:hypothetical protein